MILSSFSITSLLLSYVTIFEVAWAAEPVAATWSSLTFGPDGPWPAVEVILGNRQKISMYPGREFQSFLLTSEYCDNNMSLPCYSSQAGLYDKKLTGSTGQIKYQAGANYMMGLDIQGSLTAPWVDTLKFGGATVENVSLALLTGSYTSYPNGRWYPLTVGCLGIGAPGTINQSFSLDNGEPLINASLIPGYLSAHNTIESNSFSMHIGSANPPMQGSFYFGGYDQNRIVGDILTYSGDYTNFITLRDIGIKVIDGSSPWVFDSLGGLLGSDNLANSPGGLKVAVDGCSPYLTLPKSTCDAIANNLPVTYNNDLGLYFWNTNDPKYTQVVNSASVLEFVFLAGSNMKNVSISVPFRHLNLTLTAPLVDTSTQYFPCYTGSSTLTLGRAFLQDAFVGANWGTQSWWLAQAPGPNVPPPSVIQLASEDSITASSNDWKESWSGFWTALSPDEAGGSASANASSGTASGAPNSDPTGSLSTGAQVGIGIGAGVIGLATICVIAFCLLHRRKAARLNGMVSKPTHAAQDILAQESHAPVKFSNLPNTNTFAEYSGPPSNTLYSQQYIHQQHYSYPQQYPQPYPAELSSVMSPIELPGSTIYDPQLLDGTQVHGYMPSQQTGTLSQTEHPPGPNSGQSQGHGRHGNFI
ncbi:acid protease [Hypoxylon fragiforme]|uniref:acid protease n=1 Tax=Hypoxylon fragiforme TaxID=63214 RepID=UPI0020C72ED8|nr:acid protease [Hypoxylon fragiforme]KAI2609493.1 acid protease [Hypoxylon fragiforme]